MNEKYKLVVISDIILSNSGVGNQTRFIVDHLVRSGKFKVIHLGVALKHEEQRPIKLQEYGDDLVIIPVNNYSNPDLMRQIIDIEKPDGLFLITDPRFYVDLFRMENEIHTQMPIMWWSIWDNYDQEDDFPEYNRHFYQATDFLGCINKCTYKMLSDMGFQDKIEYIPHGVPPDIFKISEKSTKEKVLGPEEKDHFLVFYNSRNAHRKRTGNCIMAFKYFRDMLPENEKNKVKFLMNTPPHDPEGQDLFKIIDKFGLKGLVGISEPKHHPNIIAEYYNAAEATLSLSSEEGFGLCILESLMCGTPVVCSKTGGMKDQAIDPDTGKEFGFCIQPQAKSLVGSQQTPYIFSHHIDPMAAAEKLKILYDDWKLDKEGYKDRWAGQEARNSMLRRFALEQVQKRWEIKILETIDNFKKSKENRKVKVLSV